MPRPVPTAHSPLTKPTIHTLCAHAAPTTTATTTTPCRSRGSAKTEEGALIAKSLFLFHGLSVGVNMWGLADGSSPSWLGVFLSPSFMLTLGFGSMVMRRMAAE